MEITLNFIFCLLSGLPVFGSFTNVSIGLRKSKKGGNNVHSTIYYWVNHFRLYDVCTYQTGKVLKFIKTN